MKKKVSKTTEILIFGIIVFMFLGLSCSNNDINYQPDKTTEFLSSDIPFSKDLSSKPLGVTKYLLNAFHLVIVEDSLIVIGESIHGADTLIKVFNMNENRVINSFGTKGKGPKEYLTISSLNYNSNKKEFYAFDNIAGRLMIYPLNDLTSKDPLPITYDIGKMDVGIKSTQLVYNGNQRVLWGMNELFGSGRIIKVDLSNDSVKTFGQLLIKEEEESYPDYIKQQIYQGDLFVNPQLEKIAIGTFFADHLELYTTDPFSFSLMHGPDVFDPVYRTITPNIPDAGPSFAPARETQVGYMALDGTDNYIYGLYRGKREKGKNFKGIESELGKSILVFNWDGTPQAQYILDQYLLDFSISSDGKKAYGLTYGENADVYVYELE